TPESPQFRHNPHAGPAAATAAGSKILSVVSHMQESDLPSSVRRAARAQPVRGWFPQQSTVADVALEPPLARSRLRLDLAALLIEEGQPHSRWCLSDFKLRISLLAPVGCVSRIGSA